MNRTSKITLLALAIAPLCATVAQAETIYLKCSADGSEQIVTIDTTANTVNNISAKINATSIEWYENQDAGSGASVETFYKIDRTTGVYEELNRYHFSSGNIQNHPGPTQSCVPTAAPATKF